MMIRTIADFLDIRIFQNRLINFGPGSFLSSSKAGGVRPHHAPRPLFIQISATQSVAEAATTSQVCRQLLESNELSGVPAFLS